MSEISCFSGKIETGKRVMLEVKRKASELTRNEARLSIDIKRLIFMRPKYEYNQSDPVGISKAQI